MTPRIETIMATCWSFSNSLQEIPYHVGITNNKWFCSCPANVLRNMNCKHIKAVKSCMVFNTVMDSIVLTDAAKNMMLNKNAMQELLKCI